MSLCVLALLTGASRGRSGSQPAAGARGRAKLHKRWEGMTLRAHSLTSQMGERLKKDMERELR